MPLSKDIYIRQLTIRDQQEIRAWPTYDPEFALLDYALRDGGWLDTLHESPTTRRFSVLCKDVLIGFCILTHIDGHSAEFYVAIHPHFTGRGFGRQITVSILNIAFKDVGLENVYLKVRKWHSRAISLYQEVGFIKTGETTETIQDQSVDFYVMNISRSDFNTMA